MKCRQGISLNDPSDILGGDIQRFLHISEEDHTYTISISDAFYESEGPLALLFDVVKLISRIFPEGLCTIKEVELPKKFKAGPKLGKSEFRKYIGVRGPSIASSIGLGAVLHPSDHVKLFQIMSSAGLDVGFDPPYLRDNEVSPYYDRAHQIVDSVDRIREDYGKKVLYFMTLPSDLELLDKAVSIGLKGIYANLCRDLARINDILEFRGKLFLAVRNVKCMSSCVIPLEVVLSTLRELGFDIVERPAINKQEEVEWVRKLDTVIGDGRAPSMPITSPRVHPGNIIVNIPDDLGIILMGDLGVYGHPLGLIKGISSLREILDSFMRGESLLSVIRRNKDVGVAVEKWGYLVP